MNKDDYTRVLEVLDVLLARIYVHTQSKEARLGVDFRQRLTSILADAAAGTDDAAIPQHNWNRLADFVADLRDHHTRLSRTGSDPRYLPFSIEKVASRGVGRYIVSRVLPQQARLLPFGRGDRITSWNAQPMDDAVRDNATHYWGATEAAYLAQGLKFLTHRPVYASARRSGATVDVGYRLRDGTAGSVTLPWLTELSGEALGSAVVGAADEHRKAASTAAPGAARTKFRDAAHGVDNSVNESTRRVTQMMAASRRQNRYEINARNFAYDDELVPRSDIGYLRVWDFEIGAQSEMGRFEADLKQVINRANASNRKWVLIDLRDNPGGSIRAADQMLAGFTGTSYGIPLQFRATDLTERITRLPGSYAQWHSSIKAARAGSMLYSETSLAYPNEPTSMPRFQGQLALLVNGCTESAAEMLAARFADERLGPVYGTDATTAGSGSNPLTYAQLQRLMISDFIALPESGLPEDGGYELLRGHFAAQVSDNTLIVPESPLRVGNSIYWYLTDTAGRRRYETLYLPFVSTACLLIYDLDEDVVLPDLPDDVNLSISFRRSTRARAGSPQALEDLGVAVDTDKQFALTARDVLEGNLDLRARVAASLAQRQL